MQMPLGSKYRYIIFISLIVNLLNSCQTHKAYTLTRDGSDQILNGSVQKAILQDAKKFPWYPFEYNSYQTKRESLDSLKTYKKDLSVFIVGGTWCSDTQRELPRFLKIMDQVGVPDQQIELVMTDRNKKCAYINLTPFQIEQVPTFILMRNGKEIGRIIESSKSRLEYEILEFYGKPD